MSDERDLPEGVINADPPGGWDETGDAEAMERNAAAAGDIESAGARTRTSRRTSRSTRTRRRLDAHRVG